MNARIPKGTLMRKSQCHEAAERIVPARVGPEAVATAITIVFKAIPLPSISRGYISLVRAMLTPMMQAAPMPWSARAARIIGKL